MSGEPLWPVDLTQEADPVAQLGRVERATHPAIVRRGRPGIFSQRSSLTGLMEAARQRNVPPQRARSWPCCYPQPRQVDTPGAAVMGKVKHAANWPPGQG